MDLTSPSAENDHVDGVEEGEDKEDDDDGDGGGWITPRNIKRIQVDAGEWRPAENVTVGCVTTDFAMQVRQMCTRCGPPSCDHA